MAIRTITAPGVQINEIDKSGYTPAMTGTAVYLMGFTSKGEAYKPMEFTSRTALESYYGVPDNEAERYFYAAACETLNQGGRLYTARLPYDNAAFEKMVGLKYVVKCPSGSDLADEDLTSSTGKFAAISAVDSEIQNSARIIGGKTAGLYDLSTINEYEADEAKVPANTFLIVDATGAAYNRVTEDARKGVNREVIGIVPVVTTAANALYAQSYLNVELSDIHNYEVLDLSVLKTLVTDDYKNEGLLSTDVVTRYNTLDYFNTITSTTETSAPVFVGNLSDYPTKDSAVNRINTVLTTEWNTELSDLNSKYVNNTVCCDTKYNLVLTEVEGESLTPSNINDMQDLQNAVQKLQDYYGYSYQIDTIGNLAFAAYAISNDIGADTDIPPEVKEEMVLTSYNKVSDVVDAVIELFNETGISAFWEAQIQYQVSCTPYYENTSVPTTQSLDAAQFFPTIQPASDGVGLDPEHLKDIGVVVFRMFLDPTEGNKVSYEIVEAYAGSLYKDDKDPNTGVTKFIDTIINSQSKYIKFFSNCFSTTSTKKFYKEECDILLAEPSVGSCLGLYTPMTKEDISISKSILEGMNKAFDKVSDINKLDIDIVPDAGLANIASYLKAIFGDKGPYDLSITDDLGNSMLGMWKCVKSTDESVKMWKTIEMKLDNFCKKIRKDCMFIADGLRPLVLQGQKKIIRDTKPSNTIDVNILPYVPAICGLNTNYGAGYIDWFEQADDYTGDFFWCPPSIKAMGVYINTDLNHEYWLAPAGLNRGVISATDVAFSPNGKQAGSIYEKNWNYAINYPQDGIVLEGQKTFQTKPTALDRVNVRRMMLRLERQVYKVLRYFVYENNTAYTRQRIIDALDPIFKAAWQAGNGGINRYKIICDESINTPNVIDNNELKVAIGIVPNKSAEFLLCDFILGNQSATWEELF